MSKENKSKKLADRLFPTTEKENPDILNIPPEKRRLNTETYDFTISTIRDYLDNGHIFIPKFQRGFVWNRVQASRLIESLIINCPIPVIYLSQNSDETLSVIDGNQRLNSVKLFLSNDYELRGLTAYPELEGLKFEDLDPRFQRHIRNRTVRCIVILKDTHPQIKFDVFERLNTGSVKLNPQELRHGIYSGPFIDFLKRLNKNKMFKEMTLTRSNKRMKVDELILRFFALSEEWEVYSSPMVSFLNTFCEKNRNLNTQKIKILEDRFLRTLDTVYKVLGELAFKTYELPFKKQKFNTALFDAQMIAFYEVGKQNAEFEANDIEQIRKENHSFIENEDFKKYISSSTTNKNSVLNRIKEYKEFITRK